MRVRAPQPVALGVEGGVTGDMPSVSGDASMPSVDAALPTGSVDMGVEGKPNL